MYISQEYCHRSPVKRLFLFFYHECLDTRWSEIKFVQFMHSCKEESVLFWIEDVF